MPRVEPLESRVTPAPVFAQLNLVTDLDGENGFTISGSGVGGVNVEISDVANAGDVNGDGVGDLLVGIPFDSNLNRGRVAIVFGRVGGFSVDLNLDAPGSAGVIIFGQANGDQFGAALAGVGDVNGDGFDDFVVGAPGHDAGVASSERGAAYVIFGRATWGATLALSSLDGSTGFKIVGDDRRTGLSGIAQAVGGYNLAGTGAGGDFNGDGFDDVLIGAQDIRSFPTGGASSGGAFIVYGKNTSPTTGSPFPASFSVSALDGTNGMLVGSTTGSTFMGSEVGFVGDVNGDGLIDFSLGNMANPQISLRTSYIIFGRATGSGSPSSLILESLSVTDGFEGPEPTNRDFVGPISYGSEYVLRDIDGDGDEDLGVSFVHQQFNDDPIQGYTFVKNKGSGYSANPFGNLDKEFRQGALGFSNASVDAQLYDLGDFDGDGFYDIASFPPFIEGVLPGVFSGRDPAKTYVVNNDRNSEGVLFAGLNIPAAGSDDPRVFFIGDVSGDGIDDALILPPFASSSVAAAPNAYVVFGNAINPSNDGKSVKFLDVDGDEVTVKTNKGAFTAEMFTMVHPVGAVDRGQQIALLDLTSGGQDFKGANLTVSVKKAKGGDGQANVFAIDATGIDLGTVKVKGVLGSITAGDTSLDKGGIKTLDVSGFGEFAGSGPVAASAVVGRIGTIKVKNDFAGAAFAVTGSGQGVGKLEVGGEFGAALTLAGPIETFKSGDISGAARLIVQDGGGTKARVTAKEIADGAVFDIAGIIAKFKATQVGDATIGADRIDTLEIKGDLAGQITLDNAGADAATKALGDATIAGLFGDGTISVAGSVGSFTAAAMQSASLLVGFTPVSAVAPLAGGAFIDAARLGRFEITGKAAIDGGTAAMDDSFVVATLLGRVSVKSIDSTTGTVSWGFAYRDSLEKLAVKSPAFTHDTGFGGAQSLDDFTVLRLT